MFEVMQLGITEDRILEIFRTEVAGVVGEVRMILQEYVDSTV